MISFTKYYTSLLLSVLILLMTACSNDDSNGGGSSQTGDAYWKISSTVKSASGSSAIIITGTPGTIWNAEITEHFRSLLFSYYFCHLPTGHPVISDLWADAQFLRHRGIKGNSYEKEPRIYIRGT